MFFNTFSFRSLKCSLNICPQLKNERMLEKNYFEFRINNNEIGLNFWFGHCHIFNCKYPSFEINPFFIHSSIGFKHFFCVHIWLKTLLMMNWMDEPICSTQKNDEWLLFWFVNMHCIHFLLRRIANTNNKGK